MLRRWGVLQNNLVLSTKLIKHIGHRKVFKVDVSSVRSLSEQRSVLTVYHISSNKRRAIISSFGGGEGRGGGRRAPNRGEYLLSESSKRIKVKVTSAEQM